jgi:hypothetical protein
MQKQIPFGNDRKKGKSKGKSNSKNQCGDLSTAPRERPRGSGRDDGFVGVASGDDKRKRKCKRRSRFPSGMTERKARAKTKAKAKAKARARARAKAKARARARAKARARARAKAKANVALLEGYPPMSQKRDMGHPFFEWCGQTADSLWE